jgi:N-ethylmaleimide reductase
LSPLGSFNDMGDDDPEALFRHVAEQLNRFNLAYLHIVEPEMARDPASPSFDPRGSAMMKLIRAKYSGTLIVCGGYDYRKAIACLEEGGGGFGGVRTLVHRQSRPPGALSTECRAEPAG